jgi:hypothetical protein
MKLISGLAVISEPPKVGGSKNASFCPFSNYLYSASYNGGARVIVEA